MSSDRFFARLCARSQTICFGGVVSVSAVLVLVPALAECDLKDITKAPNHSKAAQENFNKLAACVKSLQEKVARIQNSSGEVVVKGTDGSVAGSHSSVSGLSGTYGLKKSFVVCPPGSFVSAIQGFKPSGQAPIVQIRYACRSVK